MGIFGTTRKRSTAKELRVPKAPKTPRMGASVASWDRYKERLDEYNKKVDSRNKEVARRKTLKAAKLKIDRKK